MKCAESPQMKWSPSMFSLQSRLTTSPPCIDSFFAYCSTHGTFTAPDHPKYPKHCQKVSFISSLWVRSESLCRQTQCVGVQQPRSTFCAAMKKSKPQRLRSLCTSVPENGLLPLLQNFWLTFLLQVRNRSLGLYSILSCLPVSWNERSVCWIQFSRMVLKSPSPSALRQTTTTSGSFFSCFWQLTRASCIMIRMPSLQSLPLLTKAGREQKRVPSALLVATKPMQLRSPPTNLWQNSQPTTMTRLPFMGSSTFQSGMLFLAPICSRIFEAMLSAFLWPMVRLLTNWLTTPRVELRKVFRPLYRYSFFWFSITMQQDWNPYSSTSLLIAFLKPSRLLSFTTQQPGFSTATPYRLEHFFRMSARSSASLSSRFPPLQQTMTYFWRVKLPQGTVFSNLPLSLTSNCFFSPPRIWGQLSIRDSATSGSLSISISLSFSFSLGTNLPCSKSLSLGGMMVFSARLFIRLPFLRSSSIIPVTIMSSGTKQLISSFLVPSGSFFQYTRSRRGCFLSVIVLSYLVLQQSMSEVGVPFTSITLSVGFLSQQTLQTRQLRWLPQFAITVFLENSSLMSSLFMPLKQSRTLPLRRTLVLQLTSRQTEVELRM